ncbi:MAG: site-specific integrase [Parabacteroides sp.]|nr:site-specific integrase [Parabacteroides sp.]
MDYLGKSKDESGKKGTAGLYKATRNQLASFCDNRKLNLKGVNALLVRDFVAYLQSQSLSHNSVSNYTSIFRATYNRAVSEHLVIPLENPFNKLRLSPVKTYKRSISPDVIKEITRLDLKGKKRLDFARDLFLFSFMACGMAFVDLAHLTYKNIHGNVLVYYRAKTKTEIRVTITPGMRRMLEKYADPNSNLLFPVLSAENVSYEKYKVALRTYNRRLEKIGSMLSTPAKLTSYVARHSWAMCAKNKSTSVAAIGQALGHTSEKTTNFYLSELDQTMMDRINMKIINFAEKWVLGRRSYY